jgi:hypothetical protein
MDALMYLVGSNWKKIDRCAIAEIGMQIDWHDLDRGIVDTVIRKAMNHGVMEIVEHMMMCGIDFHTRDIRGAVQSGNVDIAEYLAMQGVPFEIQRVGSCELDQSIWEICCRGARDRARYIQMVTETWIIPALIPMIVDYERNIVVY